MVKVLYVTAVIVAFNVVTLDGKISAAQTPGAPSHVATLLRLSEIIGSLHFLTLLCQRDQGEIWRDKMTEIIDAEATTKLRKAQLTESFNAGFDSFQASYRKCTRSAEISRQRYVKEAQTIIRDLTGGAAS